MIQHFKRQVLYIAIITIMIQLVSLMFILITYYWVSMIESMLSTKNNKEHKRVTTWHTSRVHWRQEFIEVQTYCGDRSYFSVGNRPLLLWISFPSTVTNQSYCDNKSLSCGVDRKTTLNLHWKVPIFSYPLFKLITNGLGRVLGRSYHYKKSKCYLLQLVLFYFDCSHWYLYQQHINCFCHV